jgi:hypothetical protein
MTFPPKPHRPSVTRLLALVAVLATVIPLTIVVADRPARSVGLGTVVSYPAGSAAHAVTTADFNEDGKTDVAVASQGDPNVYTLIGSGTGRLGQASPWPVSGGAATPLGADPWAVTSCDLNGDRHADLIVADHAYNAMAVLLGYGNSSFAPVYRIETGAQPTEVICADFNRDGKADLVAGTLAGGLLFYRGNGDGTVVSPVGPFFASGTTSLVVGDFAPPGGDGKLDLATALGDALYTLAGNGDGTFQSSAKRTPLPSANISDVAVGDFDGDGRPDLAAAVPAATAVYVWFANDDGFGAAVPQSVAAQRPGTGSLAVADVDQDGRQDLVVSKGSSGLVGVLLDTGTTQMQHLVPENESITTAQGLAIGDLNRDGAPDVIVAQGSSGVGVLLGQVVQRFGYWFVAADGGVFNFGDAGFYGSAGNRRLAQPIVGMAGSPTGRGYWFVAGDGGVFAFGDARFFGSTGDRRLARPIVGMAASPTGRGYWFVAADGGVFAFGDASFFGSTGSQRIAKPIVGMAATPSGKGYWLVASDGGVFAFGDAAFKGSTGALRLRQPIVGMAATPTGQGYWLVASDGGIFAFGDARFFGSTGNRPLRRPIVGMAATVNGQGYWLVAADGGLFTFGDAQFRGSLGDRRLARPIVGMARAY